MKTLYKTLLPLTVLVLTACSSSPDDDAKKPAANQDSAKQNSTHSNVKKDARWHKETAGGRYQLRQDVPPEDAPKLDHVKNAVPRYEPYTRGGNKNYNVWGKDYEVWQDIEQYQDEGLASWYGAKFHGYHTSNGEVYDMYAMTAAHKHLPLPSFVKVTNQANGKQVIVRVNDRGPFHEGRVIDLSYAAAYKLDMLNTGTANVSVELIKMPANTAPTNKQPTQVAKQSAQPSTKSNAKLSTKPSAKSKDQLTLKQHKQGLTQDTQHTNNHHTGKHIQLMATRSPDKAKKLAASLSKEYGFPARVERQSEWYRLQMGPIPTNKTQDTLARLMAAGYAQAYFVN